MSPDTADQHSQSNPPELNQEQAQTLARLFNLAFTSVGIYGPQHPSTEKNASNFTSALHAAFVHTPTLSLILEHGRLYLEEYAVDAKINVRKLVSALQKGGVQSVTFERGAGLRDIRHVIAVLADPQTFPTVDRMKEELSIRAARGIRLNYVVYQQVKADEAIVDKTDVREPVVAGGPDQTREEALAGLGSIFTLRDLVERPSQVATTILSAGGQGRERQYLAVIDQLRSFNEQVSRLGDADHFVSIDEMMEAMYKLKMELRDGLAVQREMGKIAREEGELLDEVDQLTYQTIVRLVREEYRNGAMSVQRLAFVIKRMVPDPQDLKRLLPRLKDGLLAEGMGLSEFLQLMQGLHKELQSETMSKVLQEGAEQLGLSSGDIMEAVKDNPAEAAKLIVMASEIRRGAGADQSAISELLTDYIEKASGQLALGSEELRTQEGARILRTLIYRLEKQLLDKMHAQGVPEPLLRRVEEQLGNRFEKTLKQLKSDWLLGFISAGKDMSASYLMRILDNIVEQEVDLKAIRDPLRELLRSKGYGSEQVDEMYGRIARRLAQRGNAESTLPKSVLTSNNTMFFLLRQIKLNQRYNTPFSSLMVTPTAMLADGTWRSIPRVAHSRITPNVFSVLSEGLRDLDLVGTIGKLSPNMPFVILPMTDAHGAESVKNRLWEALADASFELGGEPVRVKTTVTALAYNKSTAPDLNSYLTLLRKTHEAALHARGT